MASVANVPTLLLRSRITVRYDTLLQLRIYDLGLDETVHEKRNFKKHKGRRDT